MSKTTTYLDTGKLEKYLSDHVKDFGKIKKIKKFPGGQSNPTFLLNTNKNKFVLRHKPLGKTLPSAHAVDREYRVMEALKETDVPVPKVYHLCEDEGVIGSMFLVMEFLDGRIMWNQTLPESNPEERGIIFDEMNSVLATLHSVNLKKIGLDNYSNSKNYYSRQVHIWSKQYRSAQTEYIKDIELVINWLTNNTPKNDGQVSLVHGDYRLDNLMFAKNQPKVIGLLDWELSTLGNPIADLAYQCAIWRMELGTRSIGGLKGIDYKKMGIPTEKEYVETYCKRRRITGIENWIFLIICSLFRLISIIQGIKKRSLQGNASSIQAKEISKMIIPLSKTTIEIIEKEG
ncbi:MAG: phosphotransferase [Sphingomonadales bacterium]